MRIITGELVAVEVVRMLVGSIGLVLSVPVTTGLAAVILTHTAELPEDDGHGHHHGHVRHPSPHLDQDALESHPAATAPTIPGSEHRGTLNHLDLWHPRSELPAASVARHARSR